MSYKKAFLPLLLSIYALAQELRDNTKGTCVLKSRFKPFKNYLYQYTTESRTAMATAANGVQVSCQVEIEVPQPCKFIMKTRDCSLSEMSSTRPDRKPVFVKSSSSEDFFFAMNRTALKFTVDDNSDIQLFPETDEAVKILNIKRGIISALMVPMKDEKRSLSQTIHGLCLTSYMANARMDVATYVVMSRDLSQCDQFYHRELASSPLALLQRLHLPTSELIRNTQNCNYQLDNKGKHLVTAMCTEKHVYRPLADRGDGISSVVVQNLTFQSSKRISNRVFDVKHTQKKQLHFEEVEDEGHSQTKETVLTTLHKLLALAGTDQGQKRSGLFHELVSSLRVLRDNNLRLTVSEMMQASTWLTWQALLQCGTPGCTSVMLQTIKTLDGASLGVDALVYGLSLQANPDATLVRDMLSMAQHRQSKAIMYALANTVKKFYKGEVTTVLKDVSEFVKDLLNNCLEEAQRTNSNSSPDADEMTFLVLRVVGVMGQALQAVSPGLISSILQCVKKTDIPLSNQKAAIRAFRLMDVTDEVRTVLLEVFQDAKSPVEKRIAAYLILMKNSEQSPVRDILKSLQNARDEQLKSFVVSHLMNLHNSDQKTRQQFGEEIILAFGHWLFLTKKMSSDKSRNYRVDYAFGSMQSDIIYDDMNTLPKEVTLRTILNAFDKNYDIFEVGVEGVGFEPKLAALFGKNGLFPDSISKFLYWVRGKAPFLRGFLERMTPGTGTTKRQVQEDLVEDIRKRVQKLVRDIRLSEAPEIVAFLSLLGNELGYMKASEIKKIVEMLFKSAQGFIPNLTTQAFWALTASTKNEAFGHYIFMEEAFSLPTSAGLPLKFSWSGVLAPGAKGGLKYSPSNADLSFLFSAGLEFISQMGVHIPDYVEARLQRHTEMYHESSLNVKITMKKNQIRLSIPAPTSSTQLLSFSHRLRLVSSHRTLMASSVVEDCGESRNCWPLFSGLRFCTVVCFSHHPLTGSSRFAFEVQPSGNISEYTATITDGRTKEGGKGIIKVKTLTLKAEAGDDSTEAKISVKHSRKSVVAEVLIPHYNVEAGLKITVTDCDSKENKMLGTTIDVTNSNVPLMTLRAQTRFDKGAMLQLQMDLLSLESNASFTAALRKEEDVHMDVNAVVNLPETRYQQEVSISYDNNTFEVRLKSDLSSGIRKLLPNVEDHRRRLQHLMDLVLDRQVTMTDMKYRHIISKGIEAANIWLEKLTRRLPVLANLRRRRSLSDLTLPALPEHLFLNWDSFFRYQFNHDEMTILFLIPFGGQKSEDLNVLTSLAIPLHGLYVPDIKYQLPSFTIPPSLYLTLPLFGSAEAHTKIECNLYHWQTSFFLGNKTIDVPTYVAEFKTVGQSPVKALSYTFEGSGQMSGRADHQSHYQLDASFSHSLLDASVSFTEMLRVTDKLCARVTCKFEASSLAGLQASLSYSAQSASTLNSDEVSGDGTLQGSCQLGSSHITGSYTLSYNLHPAGGAGRGEWTLRLSSPLFHIHNRIHVAYVNSELNVVSKTSTDNNPAMHSAELRYKDSQLTVRSNAAAKLFSVTVSNRAELAVSGHAASLTVESQADDDKKRMYSLLTGAVDSHGLEVIAEAALMFAADCHGQQKASFVVSRSHLSTNVTQIFQCTPVEVEVSLSGAIESGGKAILDLRSSAVAVDSRGECTMEGKVTPQEASLYALLAGRAYDATTRNHVNVVLNGRALSITSNAMGAIKELTTENSHSLTLTLWTLTLESQTKNFLHKDVYYNHNSKVDMKPFLLSFALRNNLKIHEVIFSNGGYMKLEPFKVDLRGSMRGAHRGDHSFTHVYSLSYDNNYGTAKYNTTGIVSNAQLNHKCNLAFAGFTWASNCDVRIISDPLRFASTVRAVAVPFRLTVDAFARSDTDIHLQGNHTGQLDSTLLLTAEPLALAYSHHSQLESLHMLQSENISTNADNKVSGLLTPTDQSLTWTVKSKLNNSTYSQDVSLYNNPKIIGFNVSCLLLTDVLGKYTKTNYSGRGVEELSMTVGLTYEKSRACYIAGSPFIESFADALEQIKDTTIQALVSLQRYIQGLNIHQIIVDAKVKLMELPKRVRDFVQELVSEKKINQVKTKVDFFMKEFMVTVEDLESGMKIFWKKLENTIANVSGRLETLTVAVRGYITSGHFAAKVTALLAQAGCQLQAFEMKYNIKQSLIKVLDAVQEFFKHTEMLPEWLKTADSKCKMSERFRNKTLGVKQTIETFDLISFSQAVEEYILSVEWAAYVDQFSYRLSYSQMSERIEMMNDIILNWIDEYEIPNKLNAIYFYIRDLLLKYGLDDSFKELVDQVVILIREFKIDETVRLIVDALKLLNVHLAYEKMMHSLQQVVTQVKSIDFKRSIEDLTRYISLALKSMRQLDYVAFVAEINQNIVSLTNQINEQLKIFDIVRKIEGVRVFLREVKSSLYAFLDELRGTKISDALRKLEKVIETTIYNDIKIKVLDILEDVRERISNMDIREEIYFYLHRASMFYSNMVAFISVQLGQLLDRLKYLGKNDRFIGHMKEAATGVLEGLTGAKIKVPTFVVPLTDLVVPGFTLHLNRLHELQIPAQISVPEFTILNRYKIPGCTIDFDRFKSRIILVIEAIKGFEIQMPDPEAIFGELKMLYLFQLPDLTFPEITLSEITFPAMHIPTLNLTDFQIEMPPIPEMEASEISSDSCSATFGKLRGEFQVNFPQYALVTTGKMANFTSALRNPQFTGSVTSRATSPLEFLEHSFEATASLENLLFTETMKATHTTFSIDHQGSLTVTQGSTEASAHTWTKVTTQIYRSDLANRMTFALGSAVHVAVHTAWDYSLFIAATDTVSLGTVKHELAAIIQTDQLSISSETSGNGQWSVQGYGDEGTHTSNIRFKASFQSAELYFAGKTNSQVMRLNHSLMAQSADWRHLLVQARYETDVPFATKSIVDISGEAHPLDSKAALLISHSAEFTGNVIGSMENEMEVSLQGFEIVLNVENKVKAKILLPLKMTGKVALQQAHRALLMPERQWYNWVALASFNHYHYNSNVTAENNKMELYLHVSASGEANLGFLTVPLSVPNITVPFLEIETPRVQGLSLWDYAGFKTLLSTPRQSFQINRKLIYYKTTDKDSVQVSRKPY